ncbi:hypothetical protein CALCODRAFT_216093 [Calocera cornea HHB12733]|uniref:Uncharacterized protein n=1 Tax=Calocera cornea HHB12733 TaxID=1353952 RepID=A0A165HCE3_9BASI|nr:hypothetical protein CALCODRAFT_216093 [Calocera cornea HHB12733]
MYGTPGRTIPRVFSVQRALLALYGILLLLFVAISIWNIQASVGFQPEVENFGCFTVTGIPVWGATMTFIAILIFDFILFFLTIIKVVIISRRGYPGVLTNLLLRDGCIYFAQIFATSLVCALFLQFAPPSVQSAIMPWYLVLTPICTGRLFLNLKAMGLSDSWKQAISGFSSASENNGIMLTAPSIHPQNVEV